MVLISKGISTNTCTDKSPLHVDSKEEEELNFNGLWNTDTCMDVKGVGRGLYICKSPFSGLGTCKDGKVFQERSGKLSLSQILLHVHLTFPP